MLVANSFKIMSPFKKGRFLHKTHLLKDTVVLIACNYLFQEMDIYTIVFVITFLFICIDFSRKSRQQEMNQKGKFKEFFFQGNAAIHSPFHTWKEKKSDIFSQI